MGGQEPGGIVTPEAVVLDFDTAGVGTRVVAELLDLLVQGTALVIVLLALSVSAGATGSSGSTIVVIAMFLLSFLVLVGYPIAFETLWNGRTLGKAALGLRVVTREGAPIRFRHAAIRGIFLLVELWLFLGSLALASILLSKRNQRIGDLVAGTVVLRERVAVKAPTAVSFTAPWGYETYVASLDVSALTDAQYGLIRSFLLRLGELTAEARASLALRLANPTALRAHHTPPPGMGPELFLACVAAAYQLRHGGPALAPPPPSATYPPPPSATYPPSSSGRPPYPPGSAPVAPAYPPPPTAPPPPYRPVPPPP